MASDKIYDGYRVYFSQDEKYLCYALFLGGPGEGRGGAGLLYCVRQRSQGVRLDITPVSNLNNSKALKAEAKVFWMPQSFLENSMQSSTRLSFPLQNLLSNKPTHSHPCVMTGNGSGISCMRPTSSSHLQVSLLHTMEIE